MEKDEIRTENWNCVQRFGKIELDNFIPYPQNSILLRSFVNISYADALGSRVRNLYKYTKIYSRGELDFQEGDVFRLTIPLVNKQKNVSEYNEHKREFDRQEKIIVDLMSQNNRISLKSIQEQSYISFITVRRIVAKLQEKEIITREGSKRSGHWVIR